MDWVVESRLAIFWWLPAMVLKAISAYFSTVLVIWTSMDWVVESRLARAWFSTALALASPSWMAWTIFLCMSSPMAAFCSRMSLRSAADALASSRMTPVSTSRPFSVLAWLVATVLVRVWRRSSKSFLEAAIAAWDSTAYLVMAFLWASFWAMLSRWTAAILPYMSAVAAVRSLAASRASAAMVERMEATFCLKRVSSSLVSSAAARLFW